MVCWPVFNNQLSGSLHPFLWCKHSQHSGCKATSLRSPNPNRGGKLSGRTSVVTAGRPGESRDGQMELGFKVADSRWHRCKQAGTVCAALSAAVTLTASPWAPPGSRVLPSPILSYPFFCHLPPRKACCLIVNRLNLTFPSPSRGMELPWWLRG